MSEDMVTGMTDAGYLAVPEGGRGLGVLVLHAWWGLNDFFKGLCDRLAGENFIALAPDLYGGRTASTVDEAQQLMETLDFETAKTTILNSFDFLRGLPTVGGKGLGVIGSSMGGAWAILLSSLRPETIRAAVIFYGTEAVDFNLATAAYQGHYCDNDEWEPVEGVRQMQADMIAAGREATFLFYPGAKHWFFEAGRPEYDPQAAELAWERTLAFLREHLSIRS